MGESERGAGARGAGKNRFERAWGEWDRAIEEGKQPPEILSNLPSEKILQLLAGAGKERRYESDILATEAMNRLSRARNKLDEVASEVTGLVEDLQEHGERTRDDVHATEDVVAHLQGTQELGAETPQEMTAHAASQLVENFMGRLDRVGSALDRLEEARRRDLARALEAEDDEAEPSER